MLSLYLCLYLSLSLVLKYTHAHTQNFFFYFFQSWERAAEVYHYHSCWIRTLDLFTVFILFSELILRCVICFPYVAAQHWSKLDPKIRKHTCVIGFEKGLKNLFLANHNCWWLFISCKFGHVGLLMWRCPQWNCTAATERAKLWTIWCILMVYKDVAKSVNGMIP